MRSIESRLPAPSEAPAPTTQPQTRARVRLLVAFASLLYFPILAHHSVRVAWDPQEDFPSFYFAARAASSGAASPYDVDGLTRLAREQGIEQRVYPFLYPPPTLVLFLPFGRLPYRSASLALMVLNHGALLGSIWLVCRKLLPLGGSEPTALAMFALAYAFSFTPTVQTIDVGQTNLLVLACVTGAWIALRDPRRDWLAGALLAIACLLKLYLVLVLVALLLRRRFRVVAFAAATAGVFALTSLVALPHSEWMEWLVEVAPSGSYGRVPRGLDWIGIVHPANQALAGLIARLTAPEGPLASLRGLTVPFDYAAACGCAGAAAWALLRARLRPNAELGAELSLALLTAYLVAPFSWVHHLVFLWGVGAVSLALALERGSVMSNVTRATIAGSALVWAWDLPLELPLFRRGPWALFSSVKCLAVLSLWAFSLHRTAYGTGSPRV